MMGSGGVCETTQCGQKGHIWQDEGISHAIAHFPHTESPINSEELTLQCSSLDGGYYTNNMIMLTS